MPTFRYRARDRFGSLLTGRVESQGRMVLAQNLKKLGYNVIAISEPHPLEQSLNRLKQRLQGIPKQEVLVITRQLSAMLSAGIPILAALESAAEQTPVEKLRNVIRKINTDIRGGQSLSQAVAQYPKIFSNLFVSMVQVGETTGKLDQSLARLAELGTREQQLRARVKAAFAYPVILVVACV